MEWNIPLLSNGIGLRYTMESFNMDNLEIVYGLFKEVRYPFILYCIQWNS